MAKKRNHGKYHDWLTDEGLLKLEGWARDGLTDEQIAHNIGIVPSTLYEWKKKYPKISESLKIGKEVVDRQVENALLKRALGSEYEEVKMIVEEEEGGKKKKRQEKVIKTIIPDVTAQIFWLKNRKPDTWRNQPNDLDRKEQELRIERLQLEINKIAEGEAGQEVESWVSAIEEIAAKRSGKNE